MYTALTSEQRAVPVLTSGDPPVSGGPTLYISTQRHAYTNIAKMKKTPAEAWVGRGVVGRAIT